MGAVSFFVDNLFVFVFGLLLALLAESLISVLICSFFGFLLLVFFYLTGYPQPKNQPFGR